MIYRTCGECGASIFQSAADDKWVRVPRPGNPKPDDCPHYPLYRTTEKKQATDALVELLRELWG